MSPFELLTTNVLPSRIWTRPFAHRFLPGAVVRRRFRARGGPGKKPLEQDEQVDVALDVHLFAQERSQRVRLAARDAVEQRSVGGDDAVRSRVPPRHGNVTLVELDEPALGPLAVRDVEAHCPRCLPEEGLLATALERGEEVDGRIRRHAVFSVGTVIRPDGS